jgi:CBS domain-containing protein
MLAKDIMTTEVVSTNPDEEVPAAAQLLLDHRISAMPVVDRDGRVLGIVSEGDLMRRAECGSTRSWWLSLLADKTAEFTRIMGTRVRDVMTRDVVSVDEVAPISEIARILETNGIKRVPVLRADRLVGIVSRADVLRGLAALGSQTHEASTDDDREIRTRTLELIRRHTSTTLQAVSVIVVAGAVYLWGTVETEADKNAVRVAAENVVGTNKVHNFLNTLPDVLRGVR